MIKNAKFEPMDKIIMPKGNMTSMKSISFYPPKHEKNFNILMDKSFYNLFPYNDNWTDWRKWWWRELEKTMAKFWNLGGSLPIKILRDSAVSCYCQRFHHSKSKSEFLANIDKCLNECKRKAFESNEFQKQELRQDYRALLDLRKKIELLESWNDELDSISKDDFEIFRKHRPLY